MTVAVLADAGDEATYGGKATKLGAAARAGLPVPPGWALSWDHEGVLPAPPSGLLAVRSSAIGEDGAGASFAGQHATVLGVTPDGVAAAVARVRASAHEPGALAYRARLGLRGEPRMGVVVQQIVDAEVAGVLFTRDPRGGVGFVVEAQARDVGVGDRDLVAAPGGEPHGEVLGAGAPLEDGAVGAQAVAVGRDQAGDDGLAEAPARLDDGRLAALAALARACQAAFGPALDLEWAFVGARLFLLQWRPITT